MIRGLSYAYYTENDNADIRNTNITDKLPLLGYQWQSD
jgi:hypothetical protein